MALTDLTNTTWYFDHMPVTISELITTYHIDFISNEQSFTAFSLVGSTYNQIVYGSPDVFPCPSPDYIWINSEYATIYITGGTDATNTTFITWLQDNATFIQHDIEIKYNNLVIASLDDTGTKTLLTAGKYCQDNIVIDYTKTGKQIYMDWALNPSSFYFDASNSEHTEVLNGLSSIGDGAFMQREFSGNFTFNNMSVIPSHAFGAGRANIATSSFTAAFPVATSIYNYAFQNNNGIESINGSACLSIGSYAFQSCYNLISVSFPSCTSISGYAFTTCSKLSDIYFPNVKRIETYAFSGCSSLTTLNFPSVTLTGLAAFDRCSYVTSASFPSMTTLGGYTFRSCYRLPSINLSKCTTIGSYAFQSCSALSQVNIPSTTNVGSYAFASCSSLTEVSFPYCTSVYSYAFLNCTNLTQAYIGKGKTFGTYCFSGCSKLESLIIASTAVATFGTGMLNNTAISKSTYLGRWGSIFVPSTLVSSYKAATGWVTFSARITSIV